MAIALSATGWWIYIDVPFTPKAGRLKPFFHALTTSRGLCYHLQLCLWHELGPDPLALPSRDYAAALPCQGRVLSTATVGSTPFSPLTEQNWLANYWVGVTTPVFQELIGWRLYPMHAFFCVVSFILGKQTFVMTFADRSLLPYVSTLGSD